MNGTKTMTPPGTSTHGVTAIDGMRPGQDFVQYLKEYAREKPEVAALWCLGVGFVLGWKLKPW